MTVRIVKSAPITICPKCIIADNGKLGEIVFTENGIRSCRYHGEMTDAEFKRMAAESSALIQKPHHSLHQLQKPLQSVSDNQSVGKA